MKDSTTKVKRLRELIKEFQSGNYNQIYDQDGKNNEKDSVKIVSSEYLTALELQIKLDSLNSVNSVHKSIPLIKAKDLNLFDPEIKELLYNYSRKIIRDGYYIVAREILQHLFIKYPTDVAIAELLFQTYYDLIDREEGLFIGEIINHLPSVSNHFKEKHAENLVFNGMPDLAYNILYPKLKSLSNHGIRILLGLQFYIYKDHKSVIDIFNNIPKRYVESSEFLCHYAISTFLIKGVKLAEEKLNVLIKRCDPNACLTLFEVYRQSNDYDKSLYYLNLNLVNYGYKPISKDWIKSNFDLRKIRVKNLKPSKDGRLVSVIMTVHKTNPMLTSAVNSVLNQSHGSIELLLIDDGSSESDHQEYLKFTKDNRVRVIRMESNSGTYACRNLGIKHSQGSYITFLDSDDWIHPERFELSIDRLDRNNKIVATTDSYVRLGINGQLLMMGSWFVRKCLAGIFWRAEVLKERIGGFDSVRVAADSELLERAELLFGKKAIEHVPVCTYIASVQEGSLSQDGKYAIDWLGIKGVRSKYVGNFRIWHKMNKSNHEKLYMPIESGIHDFPVPSDFTRSGNFKSVKESVHYYVDKEMPLKRIYRKSEASIDNQEINICMATFPGRFKVISQTVQSLINQSIPFTKLMIHVNESEEIPELPNDPRIVVSSSVLHNYTDIAKFKLAEELNNGIVFTVDDDIIYPNDYIEKMREAVNAYDGKAIIGVHGCVIPFGRSITDWDDYRNNRRVHWFRSALSTDLPVNILGTGTVAYDASQISFDWRSYRTQRMVDIHVAVEAQKKAYPMVTPQRPKDWLVPVQDDGEDLKSIWELVNVNEEMQTEIVKRLREINNWGIFTN